MIRPLILPFLLATLLLTSCGGEPEESPQQTAPPPASQTEQPVPSETLLQLTPEQERRSELKIEPVRLQRAPRLVHATGRLTTNEEQTWRVGPMTGGVIAHTYKNPGDFVRQGEVLARMHSHEIHEARAAYQIAVAELDRKKAELAYAETVAARQQRLYDLKAASLAQVEQAQNQVKSAQTAVANADTELRRTRQHIEHFLQISPAEQHADSQHQGGYHAEPAEDLIPIYAPASGTVLERTATAGAAVEPGGEPLFLISDLNQIWAMAAVAETDLPALRVGQRAFVKVQAYPDRQFSGRLTRIGDQFDPQTRTVMVRVTVPNPGHRLKPEMYADIAIHAGQGPEGVFIPESAIQEMKGEQVVFEKVDAGKFAARPIATGEASQGLIEITRGLAPGAEIVTEGAFFLKSQALKATIAEE